MTARALNAVCREGLSAPSHSSVRRASGCVSAGCFHPRRLLRSVSEVDPEFLLPICWPSISRPRFHSTALISS